MEKTYRGLSPAEVESSRNVHGANLLTPPVRVPWWKEFLSKFDDPIIRILMIAALISIMIGATQSEFTEGFAILITIFLATFVAFWNEHKANAEFDVLNKVNDDIQVRVIREGRPQTVARKELVVGDIMLLEHGEEVPADADVLEAVSLEIDESRLTGETHPVLKQPEAAGRFPATTYPSWHVLKSTFVSDGHGVFCVRAVGDRSEIGGAARSAAEVRGVATPLSRQLDKLARLIGGVAFGVAALLFAALLGQSVFAGRLVLSAEQWAFAGVALLALVVMLHRIWLPVVFDLSLLWGRETQPPAWVRTDSIKGWIVGLVLGGLIALLGTWGLVAAGVLPAESATWMPLSALNKILACFMVAVTLIVVSVPEGLPLSVTLALAYSMRRMIASNTLVRRLHASETIGAATVICSDKTGTLTMNRMTVFQVVAAAGLPEAETSTAVLHPLALVMAANSTALLERKPDGSLVTLGNPTEGALLKWLDSLGVDYQKIRSACHIERQWTFTTERKFMATIVRHISCGRLLLVKGAPEYVLARTRQAAEKAHLDTAHEFQSRGMRTIGLALRRFADNENSEAELDELAQGLDWLGIAAIEDPVRPDVPDAIAKCLSAGVDVKIVSGDTPETAREIARRIGLWKPEDEDREYLVTSGDEFGRWSDEELESRARGLKILARARPADKLRLVRCLQRLGEVVAVTGDGTNDAPALNHANVSLSMGVTGTAIAKEASDIVLLDDSFASIARAILWGRSIYLNIQHFLIFQLTINLTAIIIALAGPFIGIQLPLTVMQMLWVNLIMDTLAALALATEPPNPELMNNKPRRQKSFIISGAMAAWIFGSGLFFVAVLLIMILGWLDESTHKLTIFFTAFIFMQVWNMFNVRLFGSKRPFFRAVFTNRAFWLVTLFIVIGQVAIVEWGGQVFRTVPLSLKEWLIIVGATSGVLVIGEIVRASGRLFSKNGSKRI